MESSIGIVRPNLSELTDQVLNRSNQAIQENDSRSAQLRPEEQSGDNALTRERPPAQELGFSTQEEQEQELASAIETVARFIEPQIRNVNFTQDDTTGQRVIRVFDAESDELIKQFPSEEILELAERIRGLQEEIVDRTGILIDDKV